MLDSVVAELNHQQRPIAQHHHIIRIGQLARPATGTAKDSKQRTLRIADDNTMVAAILIDGATDGITTGIDASDDAISGAALAIGGNTITHTGGTVTTTDLDIIDDGDIDNADMAADTLDFDSVSDTLTGDLAVILVEWEWIL